MKKEIKFLVTHGIGKQEPYVILDLFTNGLLNQIKNEEYNISHNIECINNNEYTYIKIEYPTRTIYFKDKNKFIDKYQEELKPYIDTTRLMDKKINDELSNYINKENIVYKDKYEFFLIASLIVLIISLLYKQKSIKDKNIKNQEILDRELDKIDEISTKQLEFTES